MTDQVHSVEAEKQGTTTDLVEDALLWIVKLHSGAADDRVHQQFVAWCALSPSHQKAANEAHALWSVMSGLKTDGQTGLIRVQKPRNSVSRRQILSGAASLVTLSAFGTIAYQSEWLARGRADFSTTTAGSDSFILADGSKILLNACSAFNVNFTPARRQIRLVTGQAFFTVAADRARPFEVLVGDISVTALGTQFDIASDLANGSTNIAVVEHAVRVTTRKESQARAIDVQEGEALNVAASGEMGAIQRQDPSVTTAWHEGLYIAENKPLGDVIAALSRWHQGEMFVTSEKLALLQVNAVLDLRDPAGSLAILAKGLPIKIHKLSSYIIVISDI